MTTAASLSNLPSLLGDVREFSELLEVYVVFARFGRLPPPTIRLRFKELEARVPVPLARYVWHLHEHPPQFGFRPITTLARKGCCRQCGIAVHPEWVASVARGQVVYVCARCAAVFVPPLDGGPATQGGGDT